MVLKYLKEGTKIILFSGIIFIIVKQVKIGDRSYTKIREIYNNTEHKCKVIRGAEIFRNDYIHHVNLHKKYKKNIKYDDMSVDELKKELEKLD